MSAVIAAAYAAVGRALLADAEIGATAAEVAYMSVVTSAAYLWRRGGRQGGGTDTEVTALVDELTAADPITAAAAVELGEGGQGGVARWMDRRYGEIAETAESLLSAPGDAPAGPAATALGLHPDQLELAAMHRRSAVQLCLAGPWCVVADAVICGAIAEVKMWHELVGRRGFGVQELAQIQLLDPLVRTAVWERGALRVLYLWRLVDAEWWQVERGAAAMNSILLWEEETLR